VLKGEEIEKKPMKYQLYKINANGVILFQLYLNILSKQIFEETKIKNIKFKNRLFKGAVFDFTFKDGKND